MYLVVIGILSIVLAFPEAPLPLLKDRRWLTAAVAGATVAPAAVALWASRRARRRFEADPADPRDGQDALADGLDWSQYSAGVLHAMLLCLTDWPGICGRLPVVGGWPAVPGLLAVTPFLLTLLLIWLALYPAERTARRIGLELNLFRIQPVRPVWTLGRYLTFQFRHNVLFILLPMAIILLARDLLAGHVRDPNIRDPLLGTVAAAVAVLTPLILRYVWSTRPLARGGLRDRLELLCRKLKVRCRDILVWQTNGMVVNAAVVGVVPPLRYVLLSDALLERMDDNKVEAVFGHEAGHVKRHHITYILLFSLISGCLLTVFGLRTRAVEFVALQWLAVAAGVALLLKWGLAFTWISWQFERQADVFGARALTLAGLPCGQPCHFHTAGAGVVDARALQGPTPICLTAASVFADTLHDVAKLNGVSPDAGSWRHPSISARSRGLLQLASEPAESARFERRISRIKAAIFLAALASGLWALYELRLWTLL